jgi:hypothetical protein
LGCDRRLGSLMPFPGQFANANQSIRATGGTVTDITGFRVHSFTTVGSSTFTIVKGVNPVQYLVIAGGGGGGGDAAGAGGAGGYRCSVPSESSGGNSTAENPISLTAGNYSVTVGAGGARAVVNADRGGFGGNSIFHTITSNGGGGGGRWNLGPARRRFRWWWRRK